MVQLCEVDGGKTDNLGSELSDACSFCQIGDREDVENAI